jgi:hypothetical protein
MDAGCRQRISLFIICFAGSFSYNWWVQKSFPCMCKGCARAVKYVQAMCLLEVIDEPASPCD